MKDQNSIDVTETSTQKYERALDLFTESVMKPDHDLRGCAHNQGCYEQLMDIREHVLEYLKTLSNFCKLFVLKFVKAVKISDFIVSLVFIVALVSYLTLLVNKIDVVSGSTISGTTEATLNFFNCVTKSTLVAFVKVEPEAALIEIFTVP